MGRDGAEDCTKETGWDWNERKEKARRGKARQDKARQGVNEGVSPGRFREGVSPGRSTLVKK